VTGPGPHVLIVEDEAPIRAFLRTALSAHGYRCSEAATAREALLQLTANAPEIVLLDLGLPDGDGLDVLRHVRQWSPLPIVVLSARGQERDKVQALDLGADDYLTKPFGVPELLARIRVSLRHAAQTGDGSAAVRAWTGADDGFQVDLASRVVSRTRAGATEEVRLTPTEFRLLAELVKHAGKVRTHGELLKQVWGPANEQDVAYLRVYVGQLRHKLEPDPSSRPRWFLTEPGVGYRLVENDPPA
jgi:two-component system KDP operon response regulator KdpE